MLPGQTNSSREEPTSEESDHFPALLREGDRVRIQAGPFRGLEGSCLEVRPTRVILSVQLVQTLAPVEMDRAWTKVILPVAEISAPLE